ncbi:hypothetical protein NQ314_006100 [Rhamnusium bicolor]|uniref:PiggyBac transposable element-derived protein domain-containing protein n=1 Tax=Rhamnusium bicolor TaxID=1586634 RepID=A0AAV8Z7L2_9CUCU|nr:hypothetical protein NQ314_006100 [Rhamnusium bicolor]
MSYKADQARLLYLVEEINPYVSEYDDSADEDEPDNVEVLDINTDFEQVLSDSEKDSTVTSEFFTREPYFLGKDGSTKWKKHFPSKNVRSRSENIITYLPGVKGDTKKLKSPIDIWKCFIDDDILDMIVENTNKTILTAKYPVSNRSARLTDIAQPDGPYNVSSNPPAVVERLCRSISGTKRNLTIDNWFTSKELADSLLKNHKLTGKRPVSSSMFGFQESCTLVSYIPKRKKNVLLLSTLHHDDSIDQQTGKPEIVMMYHSTKGGVDIVDKLCATYNTARSTRS